MLEPGLIKAIVKAGIEAGIDSKKIKRQVECLANKEGGETPQMASKLATVEINKLNHRSPVIKT